MKNEGAESNEALEENFSSLLYNISDNVPRANYLQPQGKDDANFGASSNPSPGLNNNSISQGPNIGVSPTMNSMFPQEVHSPMGSSFLSSSGNTFYHLYTPPAQPIQFQRIPQVQSHPQMVQGILIRPPGMQAPFQPMTPQHLPTFIQTPYRPMTPQIFSNGRFISPMMNNPLFPSQRMNEVPPQMNEVNREQALHIQKQFKMQERNFMEERIQSNQSQPQNMNDSLASSSHLHASNSIPSLLPTKKKSMDSNSSINEESFSGVNSPPSKLRTPDLNARKLPIPPQLRGKVAPDELTPPSQKQPSMGFSQVLMPSSQQAQPSLSNSGSPLSFPSSPYMTPFYSPQVQPTFHHSHSRAQLPYFQLASPKDQGRIGEYTLEERMEKIQKYKAKQQKWRMAHPISRNFEGRRKVAEKKARFKGRFVKSSFLDELKTNAAVGISRFTSLMPQNSNEHFEQPQEKKGLRNGQKDVIPEEINELDEDENSLKENSQDKHPIKNVDETMKAMKAPEKVYSEDEMMDES